MDVFPENTLTQFRNKLPRPLHLDGEWEVGLVECMYPFSWFQISPETSQVSLLHPDIDGWQAVSMQLVKSFADEHELVEKKWFKDNQKSIMQISGIDDNGCVKMKNTMAGGVKLRLEGKICQTLGIPDPHVLTNRWEYGRHPWMTQNISQIFVYTDIITPHPVGDREVPLLKHFSVTNLPRFGHPIEVVPPHIAYYPVNRNPIDTIDIELRDGTGKKIPFTSGRTIITLHFRQRRSSWL